MTTAERATTAAFDRVRTGDPATAARALSAARTQAHARRRRLHPLVGTAPVVGFAGSLAEAPDALLLRSLCGRTHHA